MTQDAKCIFLTNLRRSSIWMNNLLQILSAIPAELKMQSAQQGYAEQRVSFLFVGSTFVLSEHKQ